MDDTDKGSNNTNGVPLQQPQLRSNNNFWVGTMAGGMAVTTMAVVGYICLQLPMTATTTAQRHRAVVSSTGSSSSNNNIYATVSSKLSFWWNQFMNRNSEAVGSSSILTTSTASTTALAMKEALVQEEAAAAAAAAQQQQQQTSAIIHTSVQEALQHFQQELQHQLLHDRNTTVDRIDSIVAKTGTNNHTNFVSTNLYDPTTNGYDSKTAIAYTPDVCDTQYTGDVGRDTVGIVDT
jgi:hypothetical protein